MSAWPEAIWLKNQLETHFDELKLDKVTEYITQLNGINTEVNSMKSSINNLITQSSTYIETDPNNVPITERANGVICFITTS